MKRAKKIRYRIKQDGLKKLVIPALTYRLNRSRKLELKPGFYDGRPITTAFRHCHEIVRDVI